MAKGLTISDIHWGAYGQDADALYTELEQVLQVIREEELDIVVVCGDYFDRKIDFTSRASILSIKFVTELLRLCKERKVKAVRFITGTKSHDLNQMTNFKSFEEGDNFFRVIEHVTEEEVWPGYKALFIPEEYPIDYKEYYNELLYSKPDNYYDGIFGHGSIHFAIWYLEHCESERNMGTAPVFNEKDFVRVCKNFTIFGHVHKSCTYEGKVFYNGSFSRSCHGEEDDKGFIIFDDSCNDVQFVVNDLAPVFTSIKFSDILAECNNNFEEAAIKIKSFSGHNARVRVDFDAVETDDDKTRLNIIKEAISLDSNITVKTKRSHHKRVGLDNKFEFLRDGHKDPFDTVSKYINLTTGVTLSKSEITDMSNAENNDADKKTK